MVIVVVLGFRTKLQPLTITQHCLLVLGKTALKKETWFQ